jgi:sugar lactone lactonase YvrE
VTERHPTAAANVTAGPRPPWRDPRSLPSGRGATPVRAARRALAGTLLALAGMLTFTSAPALASEPVLSPRLTSPLLAFIEPPTSFGEGLFSGGSPRSVAVETSTGDVFALAAGGDRVEKFSPSGEFISEFNGSETPSGTLGYRGLAVDSSTDPLDPSKGDVYVINQAEEAIDRFKPKAGKPNQYEYAGSEPAKIPVGVAVDSKGDLHVADLWRNLGDGLLRLGPEGEDLGEETTPFTYLEGIALAPDGDVYLLATDEVSEGAPVRLKVVKRSVGPTGKVESESVIDSGHESRAITVDASGDVYVLDREPEDHVVEYSSSGAVIGEFGDGHIGFSEGLAWSPLNGSLYVADSEHEDIAVFAQEPPGPPTPTVAECVATTPTPTSAMVECAVDPNAAEAKVYLEYGESGSPMLTKTTEEPLTAAGTVKVEIGGLAAHNKYRYRMVATNTNGARTGEEEVFETPLALNAVSGCTVSGIENEGATLHASFEGLGAAPTGWRFKYGPPGSEKETKEEKSANFKKVEVISKVEGLTPHTAYPCRLVAQDEYGTTEGEVGEFTTYGPPIFERESFEKVGSVDATVTAGFDPEGLGGALPPAFFASTYSFEYAEASKYDETSRYEFSTPVTNVAEEHGKVAAVAVLSGLKPATEYHFRLVATDSHGTADGPDMTFTTFSVIGSGLPDDRVYEMVTPPENVNADVYAPKGVAVAAFTCCGEVATEHPFQVSTDGDAIAYVADPTTGGNGSVGQNAGNEYLAVRTKEGWSQSNITPQFQGEGYEGFSPDLSVGVLISGTPLASEAPEGYSVIYARTLNEDHYHALFTTNPGIPSASFGFQLEEEKVNEIQRSPLYAGSSADGSHILFEASGSLTGEAVGKEGSNNLYEWAEGQLTSVNVLPDGEPAPGASFGSYPRQPNEVNAAAYSKLPDLDHVISAEGARVFWTDLNTEATAEDPDGATRLFVRENGGSPGDTTVQVDASQVPAGEGKKETEEREANGGGGEFWTASSDGSKVFFTDCRQLTADSTAVSSGGCEEERERRAVEPRGADLYEYDVPTGQLTDLTVDHDAADALGADVKAVIGASEDGEYVYFIARGDLAEGAISGGYNIYVSHDGETKLAAAMRSAAAIDENHRGEVGSPEYNDLQPVLGRRTAQVAPDGQAIAFDSVESLTGYDNEGVEEVYVYEAQSSKLFCASCLPTGEPPSRESVRTGESYPQAESFLPAGGLIDATQLPQAVSEDGTRVFFQSDLGLVAHDTNGVMDVYEWERDGAGSCRESNGCIYLLSGGTSPEPSYFLGASVSGDDVFFVTRAKLAHQDDNEELNIYDAHVGGVVAPSEPECSGTGCQGVPIPPPAFEAPASATFDGVGNYPPPSGPPAKQTVKKKTVKKTAKKKRAKRGHRRSKKAAKARHVARRARDGVGAKPADRVYGKAVLP